MKKIIVCFFLTGLLFANLLSQTTKSNEPMLNYGLGSLPLMMDAETRLVSPENPTGEIGKRGMAIPEIKDRWPR